MPSKSNKGKGKGKDKRQGQSKGKGRVIDDEWVAEVTQDNEERNKYISDKNWCALIQMPVDMRDPTLIDPNQSELPNIPILQLVRANVRGNGACAWNVLQKFVGERYTFLGLPNIYQYITPPVLKQIVLDW